jgi:hypothetical protein
MGPHGKINIVQKLDDVNKVSEIWMSYSGAAWNDRRCRTTLVDLPGAAIQRIAALIEAS